MASAKKAVKAAKLAISATFAAISNAFAALFAITGGKDAYTRYIYMDVVPKGKGFALEFRGWDKTPWRADLAEVNKQRAKENPPKPELVPQLIFNDEKGQPRVFTLATAKDEQRLLTARQEIFDYFRLHSLLPEQRLKLVKLGKEATQILPLIVAAIGEDPYASHPSSNGVSLNMKSWADREAKIARTSVRKGKSEAAFKQRLERQAKTDLRGVLAAVGVKDAKLIARLVKDAGQETPAKNKAKSK